MWNEINKKTITATEPIYVSFTHVHIITSIRRHTTENNENLYDQRQTHTTILTALRPIIVVNGTIWNSFNDERSRTRKVYIACTVANTCMYKWRRNETTMCMAHRWYSKAYIVCNVHDTWANKAAIQPEVHTTWSDEKYIHICSRNVTNRHSMKFIWTKQTENNILRWFLIFNTNL